MKTSTLMQVCTPPCRPECKFQFGLNFSATWWIECNCHVSPCSLFQNQPAKLMDRMKPMVGLSVFSVHIVGFFLPPGLVSIVPVLTVCCCWLWTGCSLYEPSPSKHCRSSSSNGRQRWPNAHGLWRTTVPTASEHPPAAPALTSSCSWRTQRVPRLWKPPVQPLTTAW